MGRKWWRWGVQLAVLAVVAVVVARALHARWDEFRALEFAFTWRPELLALAAALVVTTYLVQIESWRRVLRGWGRPLAYGAMARIWCLANLARYVPGKIWGLAGLVVLARREGVPAWLAGAATVAMQALTVGTCVALIAATVGGAASPVGLAVGGALAAGTVLLLTRERPVRAVARLGSPAETIRPLPPGTVLVAALFTQLSWVTYGVAFWLLGHGMGVGEALSLPLAAGVFALGYLLGLLAVFAPAGVGVRDLAYVGLLAPVVGGAGAVALSVGSRLLLTALEAAAGATALVLTPRRREMSRDAHGG